MTPLKSAATLILILLSLPGQGQEPPGHIPQMFAPGIISTKYHEFSCTFSPDGKSIYFTRRVPEYDRNRIMVSQLGKDGWSEPIIAPKAGDYEGIEPFISPDGKLFLFQSWRPLADSAQPSMDIWMMNKKGDEWEEPIHLDYPFNPMRSMYFSMSDRGALYTTDISGGMGTGKLVFTEKVGEQFSDFQELGPVLNATGKEIYPCIAPDESYILFTRREDNGNSNIYISFRQKNGSWNEPGRINLGLSNVSMPRLSPDGNFLYFTHTKERLQGDIYWIDAAVIEELRPVQ